MYIYRYIYIHIYETCVYIYIYSYTYNLTSFQCPRMTCSFILSFLSSLNLKV